MEVVQTDKYTLKYNEDERIVDVLFSETITTISLDLAKEVREKILEITKNDKFGMLADFKNTLFVDTEAREYWAKDQSGGRIVAVAGCYKNELQKAMANLFLTFKKIEYKIKFFTNCLKARQWLTQILQSEIQK